MGRRRTIDRDKVLDAAEAVVNSVGAAGLTIDAVAKASGITKGGVQYCFGNKDGLIDAMMQRWFDEFDAAVAAEGGDDPDPIKAMRAHAAVTARMNTADNARTSGMMAALLQREEHMAKNRAWYRARLDGLDLSTEEGRRARMVFLATEGVFLLRGFGFLEMEDAEWQDMFADILKLLPERDRA
ncbi:TetR/AcrR family transcriptional regulator [Ensifer sp. NPDC090286]|uniref:TetR/AcrR family transcriptional regulator n=1 Tax=unclassified Ensifer TaxID=2633371 RepID=UPI0017810E94|nr:TetR/AcrR family transcriptional regulator [Ensifer sp. ENS09]MBD9652162.1 TetR family transcriptional regulator [Ensifer sp. ENS09]